MHQSAHMCRQCTQRSLGVGALDGGSRWCVSCTLLLVLLIFCPPAPDPRMNFSSMSCAMSTLSAASRSNSTSTLLRSMPKSCSRWRFARRGTRLRGREAGQEDGIAGVHAPRPVQTAQGTDGANAAARSNGHATARTSRTSRGLIIRSHPYAKTDWLIAVFFRDGGKEEGSEPDSDPRGPRATAERRDWKRRRTGEGRRSAWSQGQ